MIKFIILKDLGKWLKNLNNAGITDSAKNNAMIMENLLNTAGGVTSSNRKTSIVVSGSGGNVRFYATWKFYPMVLKD